MKKSLRKVLLPAMILMLAGCGGKSGGMYDTIANNAEAPMAEEAAYGIADYEEWNGMAEEEAKSSETAAEPVPEPKPSEQKLVYRGDLSVETLNYEETVKNVRTYVQKYNGLIEYENEYDNDYGWYTSDYKGRTSSRSINMTVRIPTESFSKFIEDMEGTGKIVNRSTSIENITRRYNDTSVRVKALKEQQERLLEMMEKAQTIEEMIAVEQRLTEVQTDLNILQTQLNEMDTDVYYSTVTVNVREVIEYSKAPESFFENLGKAFARGWRGFVEFLEDLAIAIADSWPFLLILIAAAVFAVSRYKKTGKSVFKDGFTKILHRKNKDKNNM